MRSTTELKDYVWEEAEEMGVEIESVREISDNNDGTTLRVLLEDGDTEADQVGFQVSRPNVDTGRNMFNRRVANGLRELRKRLRGDTGDIDQSATDPQTETDQNDQEPTSEPTLDITTPPSGSLSVTVKLDDDSQSELEAEFEALLEEIEDSTVSPGQLEELETRIDDIDSRLQKFEETFSAFADN